VPTPQLSDNQSLPNIPKEVSDKEELCKFIDSCIKDSDSDKSSHGYPSDKDTWQKKYRGGMNLYSDRAGNKKPHESRVNYFKKYVDLNTTIMTKFEPEYILKRIDDDLDGGVGQDLMERILYDVLEKNKTNLMEQRVLTNSGIKGNGLERWVYEPEFLKGLGYPKGSPIDPSQFGINPGALSIEEARYAFWKRPVPTQQLKKQFPEYADKIKADKSEGGVVNQDNPIKLGNASRFYGTDTGANIIAVGGRNVSVSQGDTTDFTEFYFMDDEEVTLNDESDLFNWIKENPGFYGRSQTLLMKEFNVRNDGNFPKTQKKNPFGRKVYKCNNIILEDAPNPYCRFPFFGFGDSIDPESFWTCGIVETIFDPCNLVHIITSSIGKNVQHRATPPWLGWNINMTDKSVMRMKPNQFISARTPDARLQPLDIPQVAPGDVMHLINYLYSEIESVTSLNSVLSGVRPQGVYTGTQLNMLMDGAMAALKPKFTRFNEFRKQRAMFIVWCCQAYLTEERKISLMNEDEKVEQHNVNQRTVNGSALIVTPSTDLAWGEYDMRVEINANQPLSKGEQIKRDEVISQIMNEVDKVGSVKYLFNSMDVPGKRRLMKHYENAYNQMAQAQQEGQAKQEQIQQAMMGKQLELAERKQQAEESRAKVLEVKAGTQAQKEQYNMAKIKSETLENQINSIEKLNEIMGKQAVDDLLDVLIKESMGTVNG
jgi:hypothetical protein